MWNLILPTEQKSRTYGKWSPTWEGLFCVEKVFFGNAYGLVEVEIGSNLHAINGKYLKSYHELTNKVQIGLRPLYPLSIIIEKKNKKESTSYGRHLQKIVQKEK